MFTPTAPLFPVQALNATCFFPPHIESFFLSAHRLLKQSCRQVSLLSFTDTACGGVVSRAAGLLRFKRTPVFCYVCEGEALKCGEQCVTERVVTGDCQVISWHHQSCRHLITRASIHVWLMDKQNPIHLLGLIVVRLSVWFISTGGVV